jgi:hypothetical protein
LYKLMVRRSAWYVVRLGIPSIASAIPSTSEARVGLT